MGVFYAALLGASSVLVAIIWLAKIDQVIRTAVKPIDEPVSAVPAYKRVVLVVVALTAITILTAIKEGPASLTNSLILYPFALLVTYFVGRMVIDAFFLQVRFDESGVYGSGRFQEEVKIPWGDIESIKYSDDLFVFVIRSGTKKIRLCRYSNGLYPLLKEMQKRAPQNSTQKLDKFLEANPTS
tara:strand:- start:6947 stop:7498 length:552 start_codon:yes stop_codon:yes gene_type:complete